MSATTLLQTLQATGITLEVSGDRLAVHPASLLTDELRAAIRQHKAELLAELRADATRGAAAERPAVDEPKSVAEIFSQFYAHLMGPGKVNRCCFAPADRYCAEGRRLHDLYQATCRESGAS